MLAGTHAQLFIEGEMREIDNLFAMGCFIKVKRSMLQRGDKVLPTTWAYRYKLNPDGSIKECRSKLCVRGDRETHEFAKYSAMVSLPILQTLRML